MSILAQVSNAQPRSGLRAVIAGVEKMGKTTLSCSAPRVLLVPLEIGYAGMTVHKTPMLTTWEQVLQTQHEILTAAHAGTFAFQTVVFDSGTALERLIHDAVIRSDPTFAKGNAKSLTMESALGGYGKAYQRANEMFSVFLQNCDYMAVYYGINIIITCHVFASKVIDPQFGEYDSWDLLLHSPKNQKTYGKREIITQWADLIGFLHEPMFITKGQGETMARGTSAGQGKVLAVNRTPAYVAGNRYGVVKETIPIPKDKGWNYLAQEIYNASGFDCYNRD